MNGKGWLNLLRTLRCDARTARRRPFFAPRLEALEARVVLDDNSAGILGIVARDLSADGPTLTGAGVGIGQVELTRPGKPSGADGDSVPNFAHPDVNPTRVWMGTGPARTNAGIDAHAEMVAGVMIASNGANLHLGVAPEAQLYAAAVDLSGASDLRQTYEQFALTLQEVARANVRAINLSAGAAVGDGAATDGGSLLTQFVDWSARVHDTLYVVAGVHGADGFPMPTDEYNGLTVAFTSADPFTGIYQYVDPLNNTNHDAAGARTSIDLVAPGRDIWMPTLGQADYIQGGQPNGYFGTSFAAPHVTGAVALLQQYADARIAGGGFSPAARRHEVMKAVLMNSADKLEDKETGRLLGMNKTIYKADGAGTWLTSDARDSADNPAGRAIPLDLEMGTGALNVSRALTQLQAGQAHTSVPAVGWDYNTLASSGDIRKYRFSSGLLPESYLAITLTWDRVVNLRDTTGPGWYDPGDSFVSAPLADLDVYLMPAGATSLADNLWSSVSRDSNVEHIFLRLPRENQRYEIWVRQNGATGANYALAWWGLGIPVPVPCDADSGDGCATSGASGGAVSLTDMNSAAAILEAADEPALTWTFSGFYDDSATPLGLVDILTPPADADSGSDYQLLTGGIDFSGGDSWEALAGFFRDDFGR